MTRGTQPRATRNMIVAAEPVLAVEPGHVAEAQRALKAQGRNIGEESVLKILWAARALPVVLDVLADSRHPRSRAPVTDVSFEILDEPATRTPLVAVAHASEDGAAVIVQFVDRASLLSSDEATPVCVVRFGVAESSDNVSVIRFSV
jgi:hypothetical protein